LSSFFEYEHLYQLVDNPSQKHKNSQRIDKVHNAQINVCGPVRIFLSEKIHITKLIKICLTQPSPSGEGF